MKTWARGTEQGTGACPMYSPTVPWRVHEFGYGVRNKYFNAYYIRTKISALYSSVFFILTYPCTPVPLYVYKYNKNNNILNNNKGTE